MLLPKCLRETGTWQAFPIVVRTSLCEHYSPVAISICFVSFVLASHLPGKDFLGTVLLSSLPFFSLSAQHIGPVSWCRGFL